MKNPSVRQRQRGVSIVEALVSLLVLALGMMSFAALQSRLRLNSDIAKQRSEAVRIAQEDLENFRAFSTIAVDGTIANNFAYDSGTAAAATKTVIANNVVTKTNTTFYVNRVMSVAPRATGITDTPVKNLRVTVSWADRNAVDQTVTGVNQSVTLRTVISKSDPAVAASLALAPNGSPVRDLLGRDIQVPIPAKSLGDGTSAIKPLSAGTLAYVFSNDTGIVTRRCTVSAALVTNSLTLADLTSCTNVSAYLISGFVRTSLGAPDATNPNDVAPGGVTMRLDLDNTVPPTGYQGLATQLTSGYWPTIAGGTGTTIGTGSTTYSTPECSSEALQTVRYTTPVSFTQVNNSVTTTVTSTIVVAIIPQSVTSITPATVAPWVGVAAIDATTKILNPVAVGEKYVGFACLVYPVDLDVNGSTANAYTGRLAIWPTSGWTLGTTSTTFKICRYSADYNLNGGVFVRTTSGGVVNVAGTHIRSIDNQEHTYAYLNAAKSLSNQNFLIINGNRICPTDGVVEVDGQGGENYTDETTVTHQP